MSEKRQSLHARITRGNDGRIRASWRAILPAIVLFAVLNIGTLAVFTLLAAWASESSSILQVAGFVSVLGLLHLSAAGIGLILSQRLDHRSVSEYGFQLSRKWLLDLIIGFLIGAVALLGSAAYLVSSGQADVTVSSLSIPAPLLSTVVFVGAVLFYTLASVVYEEVLYRGIVFRNFAEGLTARSLNPGLVAVLSIVPSAMLFGFGHIIGGGGVTIIVTSAIIGVVFCIAYLLTGNLSMSIGIHAGGMLQLALAQQELVGYAIPTVVEMSQSAGGLSVAVPNQSIRALIVLVLLLGWVYLSRGGISFSDQVVTATERDHISRNRGTAQDEDYSDDVS